MARALKPCGTHAAYVRHRRNGEECEECKAAEAHRKARDRAAKRAADKSVSLSEDMAAGRVVVETRYHADAEPALIEVPSGFDPVESAKWRLAKVRGAMVLATPRDIAALAKREEEIIALLSELTGAEGQSDKRSVLDELAAKRAERIAKAAV